MSNRTSQTPEQKRRCESLIKQANDALTLLDAEKLNLDQRSRLCLDASRHHVNGLSVVVWQQPVLTAEKLDDNGKW